MEGIAAPPPLLQSESAELQAGSRTTIWRHVAYLAVLILIAGSIRFWLMAHTAVAARDSIGFIRYALELESKPWSEVLRGTEQHPGYPASILLVSWPVRHWMSGINPRSMQMSAQLATTLAAILLVFPLYFLGCELYGPKIAFWGAALFQVLPAAARATADGLSEGVYFLFAVTALWLAARALRKNSLLDFVLCGLAGGLAYLTRPEGALVIVATGLVLLALQAVPSMRRTWPRVLASGCCLGLAALVAGSPYYLATGKFTNKPSVHDTIKGKLNGRSPTGEVGFQSAPAAPPIQSGPTTATAGPLLAIYAPPDLRDRKVWGLKAVGVEVFQAYGYFLGIPLLLGVWCFRKALLACPGAWVLATLCLLQALVLWRLAMVMGYVSERHVLMLVLGGVFTIAAGLDWLGEKLAASPLNFLHVKWLATVFLLVTTFCWLPSTLKPLHANRAGHKAAGTWLASHSSPDDELIDPFCWAHYYAGRVFQEGKPHAKPAGFKETYFAVLDEPDKEHHRLPLMPAAEELKRIGKLVYTWPENLPATQAKVFVYAAQRQ